MIYDDVELGEEGGCNSSLDNGWSSSEFESYDEASDGEGRQENGLPHAFMRGKPPQKKTHVRIKITLLLLSPNTPAPVSVVYSCGSGWMKKEFTFQTVFCTSLHLLIFDKIYDRS